MTSRKTSKNYKTLITLVGSWSMVAFLIRLNHIFIPRLMMVILSCIPMTISCIKPLGMQKRVEPIFSRQKSPATAGEGTQRWTSPTSADGASKISPLPRMVLLCKNGWVFGKPGEISETILKMTIYSDFSREKWWFSIAMLNYQRVTVLDAAFLWLGCPASSFPSSFCLG